MSEKLAEAASMAMDEIDLRRKAEARIAELEGQLAELRQAVLNMHPAGMDEDIDPFDVIRIAGQDIQREMCRGPDTPIKFMDGDTEREIVWEAMEDWSGYAISDDCEPFSEVKDQLAEAHDEIAGHAQNAARAIDERDEAQAREVVYVKALTAILEHKPDAIEEEIDHDVDNCADCKRMEGHPISHGRCNRWYHLYYQREGRRQSSIDREQWQMRTVVRQALASTSDHAKLLLDVVKAAERATHYDTINRPEIRSIRKALAAWESRHKALEESDADN